MSIFATIGYGVLSSYCMRLSIILALASLTLISGSSGLDGPFYWISESLSLVFLSLKKRRQGKLSQLTGSPRKKVQLTSHLKNSIDSGNSIGTQAPTNVRLKLTSYGMRMSETRTAFLSTDLIRDTRFPFL